LRNGERAEAPGSHVDAGAESNWRVWCFMSESV